MPRGHKDMEPGESRHTLVSAEIEKHCPQQEEKETELTQRPGPWET